MIKTFAMTQDFAAISSATMAALLLLVLTELQATSTHFRSERQRLFAEYSSEIRASFDAYYSGTALTAEESRRVEHALKRFRIRHVSVVFGQAWRYAYALAGVVCATGLAAVLRWSALAHHPKGYTTALVALAVIAYSSLALTLGFAGRQIFQARTRTQEDLISLSDALGIPDVQHAKSMYEQWSWADTGGGFPKPALGFREIPLAKVMAFIGQHGSDRLR
ncbi:hypothetical protein ACIP5U_39060 [Streptomyces sp. NPDC088788]|uniref:hypothetical protein n=1 Tax=Streptomyces sp. NPDC088788 TaxID=3365898 RepID=UPI00380F71D3